MNRRISLLIAATLTATTLAAVVAGPASAQETGTDLEILNVEVEDAVFDAPEPANVTATVRNNGPNSASGVLHFRYNTDNRSLTGDGTSDQPFNTTNRLGPGDKIELTIPWEPSKDQIGEGEVLGYITSASDNTPDNNRANVSVFVERYQINATLLDEDHQITLPGRTTGYRVLLENEGNVPLTPVGDVARDAPRDWRAQAPSVPGGPLERGETRLAYALVTPPDRGSNDLPDGTNENATIRWSADENPRANVSVRLPNTTVDREPPTPYDFDVRVDTPSTVLAVNDQAPATQTVNVTNPGSVTDVFSIGTELDGPLSSNLTASLARDLVVLPPGETVSTEVQFVLQGDPPSHHRADATIRASSVNERLEPDATNTTGVEVRIAAPDLTVRSVEWPTPVYRADGRASVGVVVENVGQGPSPPTNATLQAVRGGFPFEEASGAVPGLAPGESTSVGISLPVGNLSGSYTLELSLDPGNAVKEAVESDNGASSPAFVRSAGLRLTAAEGIEALPGQFVRYERPPNVFAVRNQGNAREQVLVEIESQHGWVRENQSVSLAPGARTSIPLSFVIPERPGTQTDEIRVTARLGNQTTVSQTATTTTRIVDRQAPRLADVELPSNVTATQPFRVRTQWVDAIGVANATMVLVSPGNTTSTVSLEPTGDGVFEANATVFELGTYEVRFRAVDASDAGNAFDHEHPLSLTARYDRDPTVSFADPPGQRVVKAGDPIPVEVEDPAGVRSVRYEAAGGTGELAAPYRVPTDGWSEGERRVTVTAQNRYDREASATANYTVDNSPPEIADVRVQPDDAGPGETVTVAVRADGDPMGGRVEVRDASDTVVAEANLTADEDGGLTASLPLPSGEVTGLVVVEDRVGNAATREVDLGAGDSPVPGPGALVSAAAVVLAAAVATRSPRRPEG